MSAQADISNLLKGLRDAERAGIKAAMAGLDIAGEHVLGQAQQPTPVDTGALQASATSEPAKADGTILSKTIGFNTDYAAAVHEVLTAHHEIGQAKFLETAVRQNAEKIPEFVARKVAEAMR